MWTRLRGWDPQCRFFPSFGSGPPATCPGLPPGPLEDVSGQLGIVGGSASYVRTKSTPLPMTLGTCHQQQGNPLQTGALRAAEGPENAFCPVGGGIDLQELVRPAIPHAGSSVRFPTLSISGRTPLPILTF